MVKYTLPNLHTNIFKVNGVGKKKASIIVIHNEKSYNYYNEGQEFI